MNAIKNRQFTAMLELFQKMPETYEIPTMNSVSENTKKTQPSPQIIDYSSKPITIQISKYNSDEITYLQELLTGSSYKRTDTHTHETNMTRAFMSEEPSQSPFQASQASQPSKGSTGILRDPFSQTIYENYTIVSEYPTSHPDVFVHLLLDTIEPLITCMNPQEKTNLIQTLKVECLGLFKKEEYYRRETYTPRDFKLIDLDKTVDTKQPFTLGMTKCLADVIGINLVYVEQTSHGCYDIQCLTRLDPSKVSILLYASEHTIMSVVNKVPNESERSRLMSGQQVFSLLSPFLPNIEDIVSSPKVLLPTLQNYCKLYNIPIKSNTSSRGGRSVRTTSELMDDLERIKTT